MTMAEGLSARVAGSPAILKAAGPGAKVAAASLTGLKNCSAASVLTPERVDELLDPLSSLSRCARRAIRSRAASSLQCCDNVRKVSVVHDALCLQYAQNSRAGPQGCFPRILSHPRRLTRNPDGRLNERSRFGTVRLVSSGGVCRGTARQPGCCHSGKACRALDHGGGLLRRS